MSDDLDLTDEQIDSLVTPQATNSVMPESAPAEEAPTQNQFAFTARGKEVDVKDLDQLKQYASKGYDYAQLIAEHRQKEEQFSQREQELQGKYKPYEEIDQYASQNPDWWKHVNETYQRRGEAQEYQNPNETGPDLNASPEFSQLKTELEELKNFKAQLEQEKKNQQIQKEDQALKDEIQSIQTHYKDLDWKTLGADGKSLEYKVLEHAQKIGTDSFRAAFRDFYHENLVKQAELRGKETVGKEIQRNKKLGLLGETPAPLLKYKAETNPKNQSYDELERDALKELGIA